MRTISTEAPAKLAQDDIEAIAQSGTGATGREGR
jgi:hypothetical protein